MLRATPGIASARALERKELMSLMEPWLGSGDLVGELPLPALIDVQLKHDGGVNVEGLAAVLAVAVPGATIDDHKKWLDRLVLLARLVTLIAAAIVVLIGAAAIATVIFITRSMRSCKPPRGASGRAARVPFAWNRRHSCMAATKTAAIGSRGCAPMRSNSSSSEPPDQKFDSNSRAQLLRRRRFHHLSTMIAQHQIEAPSSMTITALTTRSARKKSEIIEKSCDAATDPAKLTAWIVLLSIVQSFSNPCSRRPEVDPPQNPAKAPLTSLGRRAALPSAVI